MVTKKNLSKNSMSLFNNFLVPICKNLYYYSMIMNSTMLVHVPTTQLLVAPFHYFIFLLQTLIRELSLNS
jgi:hypothetical protein